MNKKVSATDSLYRRLLDQGKVEQLNETRHVKAINKMNTHLDEIRREFKVKEIRSIETASKTILTAIASV